MIEKAERLINWNCACCAHEPVNINAMKVNVIVKPKEAVLDPQGAAVKEAMRHLGMPEVRSVRIGKFLEIDVDGDGADVEKRLRGLCRDLLSNPVIEDYELRKDGREKQEELEKQEKGKKNR
jgi:phosphoribosylformylglycinamidine synthase PurS subunit